MAVLPLFVQRPFLPFWFDPGIVEFALAVAFTVQGLPLAGLGRCAGQWGILLLFLVCHSNDIFTPSWRCLALTPHSLLKLWFIAMSDFTYGANCFFCIICD